MSSQATQFATSFERLGRRVLAQFESLPEGWWDRGPLSSHRETLLTLATCFLEESEYWVLVIIGGRQMEGEHVVEACAPDVHATMLERYERWVTQMHRVLDRLPDAIMNLFVAVPLSARETFGAEPVTVRECLLYALEQSGLLVGRIEGLGHMVAERERFLHELRTAPELGSEPDTREDDARETTNVGRAGGAKQAAPMTLHVSLTQLLKRQPDTPLGRRDALLVCLFVDQSLRCAEVHTLRVKSIDLEAGTIAVSGEQGNLTSLHPMTADTLIAAMAYLPDVQGQEPLFAGCVEEQTNQVRPMGQRAIRERIRELGERMGIAKLTPEDLCRF